MLNYLRYCIALLLVFSLFYKHTLIMEQSAIEKAVEKRLPIVIDKKGFVIAIRNIEIINIEDSVIESKVDTTVQVSQKNRFAKLLSKKVINFTILSSAKPRLRGNNLSFEVFSLKINRVIKIKKLKGLLKNKLEGIKIPLKKLKKLNWLLSVKKITFDENGSLELTFGVSKLLILILIPLLLLREIGLFLIILYQKFLSPRKKYRCARGELYGDGTCSSITKEAFEKDGFIAGIKAYRKTTKRCKEAYKTLKKKKKRDGGTCDYCAGCSGCDAGSCGGGDIVGSSCDSVPCSCDIASC